MTIARKEVGPSQRYDGHTITVHEMPPDVLVRIDGEDLGLFLSAEAGRAAGMAHIDRLIAQEQK